jgi:Uma2 family endonuclease
MYDKIVARLPRYAGFVRRKFIMAINEVKTRITASDYALLPETTVPTELIDGEIFVSASPKEKHQKVVGQTFQLVSSLKKVGTVVFAPMDVYLDEHNVFQPDIFWVSGEASLCQLGSDDYWHGAPDLVCNVLSPGTAKRDRDDKFKVYERTGVRELWLIDPLNVYVEVYILQNNQLMRQGVYEPEDTFQSPVLDNQPVEVKRLFD